MKLATNVMAALVVLGTSAVVTSSADAATVVRSVNHGPNCTTTTVRVHEHGVLRTRTVRNCAPVVHTGVVVHAPVIRRPVVHTGVVVHTPVVHRPVVHTGVVVHTPVVHGGVYVGGHSNRCVTKTVTTHENGVARRVSRRVCT